jgi:hypothetical protein
MKADRNCSLCHGAGIYFSAVVLREVPCVCHVPQQPQAVEPVGDDYARGRNAGIDAAIAAVRNIINGLNSNDETDWWKSVTFTEAIAAIRALK